jgi:hypothetical protein
MFGRSTMYNRVEQIAFTNISATPAAFTLRGGNYSLQVHATFGGGSVGLSRLSQDGSTYVPVIPAFTADGVANANLPSGTYQLAVATATGVFAEIISAATTM